MKSWKIIKWSVEQMQTAEPDFIFRSVYHQTRLVYTSDPLYLYLKKALRSLIFDTVS